MIKIENPNSLCAVWVGFYLPPFLLAYEVIYHLVSGSPLMIGPFFPAIPVGFKALVQFVLIVGGQGLIFEYVSSLKGRICFSVLLCASAIAVCMYFQKASAENDERIIKGMVNSILWSPIITLPITIFLCFIDGMSEKTSDK